MGMRCSAGWSSWWSPLTDHVLCTREVGQKGVGDGENAPIYPSFRRLNKNLETAANWPRSLHGNDSVRLPAVLHSDSENIATHLWQLPHRRGRQIAFAYEQRRVERPQVRAGRPGEIPTDLC
jgi:hypothetical protein